MRQTKVKSLVGLCCISFMLCAQIVAAQTKVDLSSAKPAIAIKDKVVEKGITYVRIKTLADLKQIGFDISTGKDGVIIAAAKGHKSSSGGCCSFNSGKCSSIIRTNNEDITSADYIEREDKNGKILKTRKNKIPYYSSKTKDVIFR